MYDHKTKKNKIRPVSEYKIYIGSKAKENKTKKRKDKLFSMYYSLLNSMTEFKKSLWLAPVKLPSQTYFCSNITHF